MLYKFIYYAPRVYILCPTRSLTEPTKLGTKVVLFFDTHKSSLYLSYYKLIINHISTTHVISPKFSYPVFAVSPKLKPLKSALSPKLSHPVFAVSPKLQPLKSALSPKLLHPFFAVSPKL